MDRGELDCQVEGISCRQHCYVEHVSQLMALLFTLSWCAFVVNGLLERLLWIPIVQKQCELDGKQLQLRAILKGASRWLNGSYTNVPLISSGVDPCSILKKGVKIWASFFFSRMNWYKGTSGFGAWCQLELSHIYKSTMQLILRNSTRIFLKIVPSLWNN